MRKKGMTNRQRTVLLIGLLLIAMTLVVAIGAIVILEYGGRADTAEEHLELAQKYVENEDYDAAIKSYWAAIKEDELEPTAYIELGSLYEKMDSIQEAYEVYSLGLERTDSSEIRKLRNALAIVLGKSDGTLAPNEELLLSFTDYDYDAFCEQYGEPTTGTVSDGLRAVVFPELDATFYFDADSSIQSAEPQEIALNDLRLLFGGMTDSLSYSALQETEGLTGLTHGRDTKLQRTVVRFWLSGCEIVIEAQEDGSIAGTDAWNRIYPTGEAGKEEDEDAATRTLTGRVIDATTGDGVQGAHVSVYADGALAAEGNTDSDGYYELPGLGTGDFSLRVTKDGYTDEETTVTVYEDDRETNRDVTISPELEVGQIRIVLTWGESPSDLDSHLEGTASGGESVHIYFGNKSASGSGGTIAELDVDDTTGYGPETTTIYDTNGNYTFRIEDYGRTGTLGSSGATVKVYVGSQAAKEYTVPSNASNEWTVLSISNGTVTEINTAE